MKNLYKKGFTLIELLVVIAIIGVLSSVVLASLNDARAKARDARRISDLRQIKTALELYRHDNGQYPILATTAGNSRAFSGPGGPAGRRWHTDPGASGDNNLAELLFDYITLPEDPLSGTGNWPVFVSPLSYNYFYSSSNGTDYNLVARLELSNINDCASRNWRVNITFPGLGSLPQGSSWCPLGASDTRANLYSDHSSF